MIFMPETPRYLFKIGQDDAAREALARIQGDAALAASEETAILDTLKIKSTGFGAFRNPTVGFALLIGVVLAALQQITGINTVIYYGPQIFQMAGIGSNQAAILAQALVGTVNCVMTLVAIFFVDSFGRKPLLYIGCSGMFVALSSLAVAFAQSHMSGALGNIALGSMMLYVGCFAFSLGPILWLLISEIFPLQSRALGMSICTVSNWVANFLVSQLFLVMIKDFGTSMTFAIYAALCIVTIVFVAKLIPETKRETLESISVRG
jgi:sugar porter (SP) family MFS transporter